jgi:transposase
MLINGLRAHLAEFGIVVVAQGRAVVTTLAALIGDDEHNLIPQMAREALLAVVDQLPDVHERIGVLERKIVLWHCSNEQCQRLETITGIGPITASAIAATVTDASLFRWAARWPPGSGWCRARTRAVARNGSDTSVRRAILTFGNSSSSALTPCCDTRAVATQPQRSGRHHCSLGNRIGSRRSQSPTRWRVSFGRLLACSLGNGLG